MHTLARHSMFSSHCSDQQCSPSNLEQSTVRLQHQLHLKTVSQVTHMFRQM